MRMHTRAKKTLSKAFRMALTFPFLMMCASCASGGDAPKNAPQSAPAPSAQTAAPTAPPAPKDPAVGPLTDAMTFFLEHVNLDYPGFEQLKAAALKNDLAACQKAFADYIRAHALTEQFKDFASTPGGFHNFDGESALEAAERALSRKLISCGIAHQYEGEIDWQTNQTPDKYGEWIWQLNRSQEMNWLASAYDRTGDEKYAVALAEFFGSWIRQAIVPPVGTSPGATNCWRTIEAGIRMSRPWPYALSIAVRSPAFTDALITDCYISLYEHGRRLRHDATRRGNWYLMELSGLMSVTVQTPFLNDSAAWQKYAVEELTAETRIQMHPDGFQFELAPGYHNVVLANYDTCFTVMKRFNVPFPREMMDNLETAYEVYVKLTRPDDRLPELNDSGVYSTAAFMANGVKNFPHRKDFLYVQTKGKSGTKPGYTSNLLPYSGIATFRDGWSPNAVWANFDAGQFGTGHQHEDKLNLVVFAYGEDMLIEAGKYAYDRSPIRAYSLATRGHNTAMVDDMDQNRRSAYKFEYGEGGDIAKLAPDITSSFSGDMDVVSGIYRDGYGLNAEKSATHKREVRFIKKHEGLEHPVFLVIDTFSSLDGRAHSYKILWHPEYDDITPDGTNFTMKGKAAKMRMACASDAPLSLSFVKGQTEPHLQGYKLFGEVQGTQKPFPCAVYEATGDGEVTVVTVIEPAAVYHELRTESVALKDGRIVLTTGGEPVSFPLK